MGNKQKELVEQIAGILYKNKTDEADEGCWIEGKDFYKVADLIAAAIIEAMGNDEMESQLRETVVIRDAYADKIIRLSNYIECLKKEITRLHEQQLDVDWEISADEAGLDKETQEHIISMADACIKAAEDDKKYVQRLEAENSELRKRIEAMGVQPEQGFTVTVGPQQPIQPVPEILLELDGVIIKHHPSPETYGGVAVWTLIGNYAITKADQERAAKLIGHKVRVKEVPQCYKTVEILWKESKPPLNTEIPTDY